MEIYVFYGGRTFGFLAILFLAAAKSTENEIAALRNQIVFTFTFTFIIENSVQEYIFSSNYIALQAYPEKILCSSTVKETTFGTVLRQSFWDCCDTEMVSSS
jgi:hypothetical protein